MLASSPTMSHRTLIRTNAPLIKLAIIGRSARSPSELFQGSFVRLRLVVETAKGDRGSLEVSAAIYCTFCGILMKSVIYFQVAQRPRVGSRCGCPGVYEGDGDDFRSSRITMTLSETSRPG